MSITEVIALIVVLAAIIFIIVFLPIRNINGSSSSLLSIVIPQLNDTSNILKANNVDLRAIAVPYLPQNLQAQCVARGGTWHWDKNYVGCSDATSKITDCSGPAVSAAMVQCQGAGGTWLCNSRNVYCRIM